MLNDQLIRTLEAEACITASYRYKCHHLSEENNIKLCGGGGVSPIHPICLFFMIPFELN